MSILFNHRPHKNVVQPSETKNTLEGYLMIVNHTKKQVVDFF